MKTFLRIVTILLAGVLVAGAVYLVVQNTYLAADPDGASGLGAPAAFSGDETLTQRQPPSGEGLDLNGGSPGRGLTELLSTAIQLSAISAVVIAAQFLITRLRRRVMRPTPV